LTTARKYVLDSHAVLSLVEDEPGAQVVAELLICDKAELHLSAISLGEIYYVILRRHGEAAAEEIVGAVLQEQALTVEEVSWPRLKQAACIKGGGGISYADAFVVGLSRELKAVLVSGDPDIRAVAGKFGLECSPID